jgi:hypothetical protein
MFNGGGGNGGGDNTIFDFETGFMYSRDASTIHLGALKGASGGISSPSVSQAVTTLTTNADLTINTNVTVAPATFLIGAKGLSTVFSGTIAGTNNITKTGAGSLTLNAILIDSVLTDNATYTNNQYDPASQITYVGDTTISNGSLVLVAPNNYLLSPIITLAGTGALLDATAMGFISNQLDGLGNLTNTVRVTNSILEIPAGNVLQGFGTVKGTLITDAGSVLNPGNTSTAIGVVGLGLIVPNGTASPSTNSSSTGVLTVNGSASIFGAVNVLLSSSNSPNCGELAATSFNIDPGATLIITNVGLALKGGDVFHVFNQGVSFANVTLPTVAAGLTLSNRLAIDGSLVVTPALNQTNITFAYTRTNGVLSLSWPQDHAGYRLQTQTNAVGLGITTNWVTVAGSTNVLGLSITNNPATNGSVFFRLVFP